VAAVISNRADAGGLAFAAAHGIATAVIDYRAFPDREVFDAAGRGGRRPRARPATAGRLHAHPDAGVRAAL